MSYQVDSYGNTYFPAGVSIASIPATTGTQARVLVPGANGRISSATVAQLITQSGGNLVSSIFGRTGVVVAKEGDYTTDQITEGQAQYFSNSKARKSIFLTTFNTSGPATYDTNTGILNIPQYGSGAASPTNFVPLTRTITINGQTADLSVDRIFSVASMVYPSAGIALSNGVSWEPSITNNSANWNTAYTDRMKWDGGATGLVAATGRTSLGLVIGTDVLAYRTFGTAANSAATDFALAVHTHTIANVTGLQTALDGKEPSIAAGTTLQYWRGDKSFQTLPIYSLPIASTTILGGVKVDGVTITIDANGVISGANTYVLPTATSTILGGVKIGAGVTITSGVISVSTNYEAPITAGTTLQYFRGDKTFQTLPIYTLAGLGGLPLAGGIMTGAITLKEGAANGLKFPNDVFGGSGDTAGMRLIARSGEAMSLEVYLTNDADDWFNISVPNDNGAKVNGNTIWHAGNLTNLNQLTNGPGYITSYVDTNTWDANSKTVAGYVAAPGTVANKVWKTDGVGNPAWRDDADTDTIVTSLPWTSITGRPTALSSFTNDLGNYGGFVVRTGDTMTNRLTIDSRTINNNLPLHILAVEPYMQIEATGATNSTAIKMYSTGGYGAYIGNYATGELVLVAAGTEVAYLNSNSIRVAKYRFNGNSTLSGNGTPEIVDIANVGMAMQSLNYKWYNNSANVLYMTLDYNGNLTANAFFESSDIRYKDVIETNPNVSLEGLDVIKFTRKGNSIIRYGYSAQQVKSLSEDLIGGTNDDMTVNYSDVHTLKIAALEKRIAELEAKLK